MGGGVRARWGPLQQVELAASGKNSIIQAASEWETSLNLLDLDRLRAAPLVRDPFDFVVVEEFVRHDALAALLADFPELGTPYRKRPNVRRLLCKPYFIYYRVRRKEQVIEVMDYWHSARREPTI